LYVSEESLRRTHAITPMRVGLGACLIVWCNKV
jgi:hypothetical protein